MGRYFEKVYGSKYLGLDVQTPEIFMEDTATPAVSNFWFRNSELRSSPPFAQVFLGPEQLNPSLGQNSFLDGNGTIHTCAFTTRGLWQLSPFNGYTAQNPWVYVGGNTLQAGVPVASRAFANLFYWTNGAPYVQSWDGIADAPVVVSGLTDASFGGVGSSVGAQFLFEMNDQICLLNCFVLNAATVGSTPAGTTTQFPQRIWYSANGIPNQFDPTINTSAGFVDFLDVPDQFTGAIAMGEIGYLFRSNGITQMTITGNALAPFYFDHLWSSDRGIGNVYPWSIAQYGSVGIFISTENVYNVSINSFAPIGGKSRDAIMGDLAKATSNPVGTIIPAYAYGFIYLTYVLSIPFMNSTRHYIYSIEDQNWTVCDSPGLVVTGRSASVWR